MGADAIVGHEIASCTKKYTDCIKCLGAPGEAGGPGGNPDSLEPNHKKFASALGMDGAGMKSTSVTEVGKPDMTGTDRAVTRANDAAV